MACQSRLEQLKTDVSRALGASDETAPGRRSARAAAFKEIAEKWISPRECPSTVEEGEPDLAAVMTRRVTAVELKAGLTDLWAQRVQRSCKSAVSRKQEQATQLLRENNSLRKENKRLRDQLSIACKRTASGKQAMLDTVMQPPAGHGVESQERRQSLETVEEDWAEQLSGAPALGSRAAPSRPTSAALSRRESAQTKARRRPSSATPNSGRLGGVRSVQGGEVNPQPKRPSSAQPLGRNGRPTAGSVRAANMPLTASAQGFGHGTPHTVAQLREQSVQQASLIEDQHADLQLLKAVLHERAMQGYSGSDEEDEDGGDLKSDPEVTQRQQQDFTSMQNAGRHKKERKRRPTSAGGLEMARARQVLQFHGRAHCR